MDAILEGLKQWNVLDASLYGLALGLGLFLRLARAVWFHFGDRATGLAAICFGAGGAALQLTTTPHPWQFIVIQSITLSVALALVELGLRSAADTGKLPDWLPLPKDNEYVSQKKLDTEAAKEDK